MGAGRVTVWQSECAVSPFVLGFVRPRIYLPFRLAQKDQEYVIAHEQAHIRHHDQWWKLIGFLLVSLYWYDPLVWRRISCSAGIWNLPVMSGLCGI